MKPRSSLLPINSECELSKSCSYCISLGYRSKHDKNSFSVNPESVHTLAEAVSLPCSSHLSDNYQLTIDLLNKEKSQIHHTVLYNYYCLHKEIFDLISAQLLHVIYTDFKDLKDINFSRTNYFLITPENWNFHAWAELNVHVKTHLHYFFLPNFATNRFSFTEAEQFDIALKMKSEHTDIIFEFPNNHDAIDSRNPNHINWNLTPRHYYSNVISKSMHREPKLSVIIPFYNRSSFVKKVLHFIQLQTLNKADFEVILVDDGSDKVNQTQLKQDFDCFKNLNIHYFYVTREEKLTSFLTANRAGPIRNLGAQKAKSEILLFLDSDILLPKNYFELILQHHADFEVVMPKRVYLNQEYSEKELKNTGDIQSKDVMRTPWQDYIDDFYHKNDWASEKLVWKYFITYALSIKADLFFKSGGFRTNYISFGYEDLDLGLRISNLTSKLKLLDVSVFHLFHFYKNTEYDLTADFRFFQLALTSRMFITQNMPVEANYLLNMAVLKNKRQSLYFYFYSFLWRSRIFFGFT